MPARPRHHRFQAVEGVHPGPRTRTGDDGQHRDLGQRQGHARTRVRSHAAERGEEEAAASGDCVLHLQGYQGSSHMQCSRTHPACGLRRVSSANIMPRAPRLRLIDPAPCFPGTTGTVQRDPPLQTLCEFRRPHPVLSGTQTAARPPGHPARARRLACNTNHLRMQHLHARRGVPSSHRGSSAG